MKRLLLLCVLPLLAVLSMLGQDIDTKLLYGRWIIEDRYAIDPYHILEELDTSVDDMFTAKIGAWLDIREDGTFSALEYDPEETPPDYVISGKYSITGNKFTTSDFDKENYIAWNFKIVELTEKSLILEADVLGLYQLGVKYKREEAGIRPTISPASQPVEIFDVNGTHIYTGNPAEAPLRNGHIYIMRQGNRTTKFRAGSN